MTRSTARTTTAGALLACVAPFVLSGGPAADAAAGPALALEAAQRTVVLDRYEADDGDGGTVVFVEGDLGVHVVAGAGAFEVRAKRGGYGEPVVLTLTTPGADLVLGTAPDATGLPAFWTTTITNAAGKVVERTTADFCPNGYEPVRRRPDAPATSPYPQGCQANPYTLGNVFGIQAGYAVPALTDPEAFTELPLGSLHRHAGGPLRLRRGAGHDARAVAREPWRSGSCRARSSRSRTTPPASRRATPCGRRTPGLSAGGCGRPVRCPTSARCPPGPSRSRAAAT